MLAVKHNCAQLQCRLACPVLQNTFKHSLPHVVRVCLAAIIFIKSCRLCRSCKCYFVLALFLCTRMHGMQATSLVPLEGRLRRPYASWAIYHPACSSNQDTCPPGLGSIPVTRGVSGGAHSTAMRLQVSMHPLWQACPKDRPLRGSVCILLIWQGTLNPQ